MKDFLKYMLFSGYEYLSIFFIITCYFNIDFKYYVKEIIIGVIVTTLLSYVLVIFNLFYIIPLPIILVFLIAIILVKIFKQGVLKSIVISISGFIINGLIQYLFSTLFLKLGYLTVDDLGVSFSQKTYIMQTIFGTVGIAIGLYTKLTNGGFGFTMSKKISGRMGFTYISVFLVVICSLSCLSFYLYKNISLLLSSLIVISVSVIIIFYLSYKRDTIEYS
jgi:hypothetical protein